LLSSQEQARLEGLANDAAEEMKTFEQKVKLRV